MSGQPAGTTLLEAIEADIIPVPEPMTFPEWQHWRKKGRRPTKKKDGISITTAEEVKLWREAMESFHDIKSDDEDDGEDEEEEEPEKDDSLELAPDAAGVPALPPLPGKSPLAAAAAKAEAPTAKG